METKADKITILNGVVLLNLMLVLGILQILQRHVNVPVSLYWTGEISRTILAFLALATIPYLFKNEADISFLPVIKRVTSHTDAILLVRNIFLIFFSVIFVWSSFLAYQTSGGATLPTLRWFKLRWAFILTGLSFGSLLVYVLLDTRNRIRNVSDVNIIRGERDA